MPPSPPSTRLAILSFSFSFSRLIGPPSPLFFSLRGSALAEVSSPSLSRAAYSFPSSSAVSPTSPSSLPSHFIRASVHYASVSSFPALLSPPLFLHRPFLSVLFLLFLPTEHVIFCRRAPRRNLSAAAAIIAVLPCGNRLNK